MSTYEVCNEIGTDLLGCEQPDLEVARIAARTLIEVDGETAVHIYEIDRDGVRSRFPLQVAKPNGRGGAAFTGMWGR